MKKPLCIAPFTSVLIDVNRQVRPCCVWSPHHYLGNLKDKTVVQILNDDPYARAKSLMYDEQLPLECKGCQEREESTGWSQRLQFQLDSKVYDLDGWIDERLRYLELNGSNHCNLACIQCSSMYSSAWISDENKLDRGGLSKIYLGEPTNLISSLKELDLSALKTLYFKGGEPLLNPENVAALLYFEEIGILENLNVYMITNGTLSPSDDLIRTLSKTKSCSVAFSIDGTAALNPYIRYSRNNVATIDTIEQTISKYNSISKIKFDIICSVMTYNIFRLVEIRDWWLALREQGYNIMPNTFNQLILNKELNVRNLTDKTREYLVDYYTKNQLDKEFEPVITILKQPYLGNQSHNEWVDYTLKLQSIRGNNILDIEPLLKDELIKI